MDQEPVEQIRGGPAVDGGDDDPMTEPAPDTPHGVIRRLAKGCTVVVFDLDGVVREFAPTTSESVAADLGLSHREFLAPAFAPDLLRPVVTGRTTFEHWCGQIVSALEDQGTGLDHLVDVVLNSAVFGVAKPDQEAYAAAHAAIELHRGGPVAREQVLFTDDRTQNVAAALAFGWQAVHFAGVRTNV